jgi:hypothetical protein
LPGDHLAAERGSVAGRPVDPGLPLPPALEITGVAVEHAALGGPVPLRREQQPPAGEPAGPFDEMDVGFLARLDKAQFGVDGTVVGDDPLRPRLRACRVPVSAHVDQRSPVGGASGSSSSTTSGVDSGRYRFRKCGSSSSNPAAPRTRGTAAEVVLSQRRNSSIEGNGGRASP